MENEIGNIASELSSLKAERRIKNDELDNYKIRMSNSLIFGGMGKDMEDTINGKKTINVPLLKRIRYKIKQKMNKIFEII
jgi:hypothetical protein